MDVPQQKYRKIINLYKDPLNNLISEYPIHQKDILNTRNLKYILQKQSITLNLSYDDQHYQNIYDDIKIAIINEFLQNRMYGIRLARALPFSYRVKFIEQSENKIIKLVTQTHISKPDSPNKGVNRESLILLKQSSYQFSYEILSDTVDLLLSVYELTYLSEEIYFDVNQRIISIFSRIVETGFTSESKELLRNCYETIRMIFLAFGPQKFNIDAREINNKLINKLIGYLQPNTSFMAKRANSSLNNSQIITQKSYSNKLYHLILKTKQFQSRIRSRFFYGLCCLLSYLNIQISQMIDFLIKQIFIELDNANECDLNIECFNSIKALLRSRMDFHSRNTLLKKWTTLLSEISYKKEYLEFFINLLDQSAKKQCPLKTKFFVGTNFLQITKNIPQQFSRFVIYKLACRNIMSVSKQLSSKGHTSMVILNIFHYSWFLDRVKQQNDLFRSQFLICLLQNFFSVNQNCSKSEVCDLIMLCHRLIDWKCSSKQQNFIPTIKFSFDMYLAFLRIANNVLGDKFSNILCELIQRCNDAQNIYVIFKHKLISTLVSLSEYQKNWKMLALDLNCKLNLNELNEEIIISIMPKNPKPIFNLIYSQSVDGLIQSRRQIQFVKVIMQLLGNLQKTHEQMNEMIDNIMIKYHTFLNNLQNQQSNRDLIYCLQTGTADQYFTSTQRNFLLSLIDHADSKGNNFELNLDSNILYSPYEMFESEDQINIFGPMSPVQLTVKFHPHNSFSSIYLQVKKNNWVSCPKLKLIISSGMQKKQLAFESSIIQIKIDRIGGLHFQVWTADGNQLLIGSGNLKIKRKLNWRKINYLGFIDGIKRKSYFQKTQTNSYHDVECYLSYYYGEPILVQIFRNCNEVLFGVSSKQIWNELQSCLPQIIQEFSNGSAIIFQ